MAEYIDREELLKKYTHFVKGKEFNLNRPVAVVRTRDIYNMPSVDAVEQKHGHWISIEPTFENGMAISRWECSECGSVHFDESNFCFSCGAKMDEVTK